MKTPSFIVRIPEPCHEDWNAMQPDAQGRFCSSCSKSVIDFSNKTDAEIRDTLLENRDKKICGRFHTTQVNRPLSFSIRLDQLPKNISATRAFAIALFLVFGTLLFSCTTHSDEKLASIGMIEPVEHLTGEPQQSLTPVVELKGDTILEPGSVTPPDFSEQQYLAGGLHFEAVNFEEGQVPSPVRDTTIKLVREMTVVTGLMQAFPIIEVDSVQEKTGDTLNVQDRLEEKIQPQEQQPGLLVYPNPTKGEFMICYDVLTRADVRVDILDMNGRLISTPVNIAAQYEGKYNIPVSLDELPNGVYFVSLLTNGRRFTEKIIIER